MYKQNKHKNTTIKTNESVEGESLEMKIDRFVNNREPITEQGAEMIFMERKEGINRAYNIRTDRFEVAIEATDAITKSINARREEKYKKLDEAKPIQDTNE